MDTRSPRGPCVTPHKRTYGALTRVWSSSKLSTFSMTASFFIRQRYGKPRGNTTFSSRNLRKEHPVLSNRYGKPRLPRLPHLRFSAPLNKGSSGHSSMDLIFRAGTPATIAPAGTSRATTAPAATIASSPMLTPGRIVACEPTHTPFPKRMGAG